MYFRRESHRVITWNPSQHNVSFQVVNCTPWRSEGHIAAFPSVTNAVHNTNFLIAASAFVAVPLLWFPMQILLAARPPTANHHSADEEKKPAHHNDNR